MTTIRFRQLADLLADIGEPCWADGPTAAALHRLDGFELVPPFHLLVPFTRRSVSRPPHVIRRAFVDADDVTRVGAVPVLTAPATLLVVAAGLPDHRLGRCVSTCLAGGAAAAELHRRIVASRRRDAAVAKRLLRAVATAEGLDTFLEREFLRLAALSGLPAPEVRRVAGRAGRLARLEAVFPGVAGTVVVPGYSLRRSGVASYVDIVERFPAVITALVELVGASVAQRGRPAASSPTSAAALIGAASAAD